MSDESNSSNTFRNIATGLGLLIGAGAALYTYTQHNQTTQNTDRSNRYSSATYKDPKLPKSNVSDTPSQNSTLKSEETESIPEHPLPPGWCK